MNLLNKLKNIDWLKVTTVTFFLSVPLASSLISTWHIFDLFELGNPNWMSVVLSIVIELGSLASLFALAHMKKIKIIYIWFIFIILFGLQVWGNVFYSYNYVTEMIKVQPAWLATFTEFMKTLGLIEEVNTPTVKLILACLIGLPIPLISLSFLKSTVDYLKPDEVVVPIAQAIKEFKEDVKLEEDVKSEVREITFPDKDGTLNAKEVEKESTVFTVGESAIEESAIEEDTNSDHIRMSTNPDLPLEDKLPYNQEVKVEEVKPEIKEEEVKTEIDPVAIAFAEPKIERVSVPVDNNNRIHVQLHPNINKQ